MVIGKVSHTRLHCSRQRLTPYPTGHRQGLTTEPAVNRQGLTHTRTHTHVWFMGKESHASPRSVLSKNSHSCPQGPGQGITPDPTGPRQGFTSESRSHRQGLATGAHGIRQ